MLSVSVHKMFCNDLSVLWGPFIICHLREEGMGGFWYFSTMEVGRGEGVSRCLQSIKEGL